MSLIASVSSLFQRPAPALDSSQLGKLGPLEKPELGGAAELQGPRATPSFGSILDHVVGEVNAKMEAGGAEQAKVLSGESTNLHQAMISMQEAGVAFSLMVEVRNKLVESYQELMRMQV
ncbi:MAG: flagellar hook-basal body complex protein FliE [Chthoniobacter sp.]|jgi:flagellar hook-basal body complex protein FliE|nr:flagellar hook-basal body complex protein FliE [Chthoniobacter sp.]